MVVSVVTDVVVSMVAVGINGASRPAPSTGGWPGHRKNNVGQS